MTTIHYHGKKFRTMNNTINGEVNHETIFNYYQSDHRVWATYSGGGVFEGHLIAIVDPSGNLDMRYHHLNDRNELMTGKCQSRPEILADGRLILHEAWEWTCKDFSKGHSIIEEI